MSTKALIGIILATVILIASFVLFTKVFSMFSNNDYSQNNFYSLTAKVQEMLDDPSTLAAETMPYYISKDFILVGFSGEWDDSKQVSILNGDENIKKPSECLGESCLCLYENKNNKDFDDEDETPVNCYNFDQEVYFSGADGYEQFFGNIREDSETDRNNRQKRWEFSKNIILDELSQNPQYENLENILHSLPFGEHLFESDNQELEIDYTPDWHIDFFNQSCLDTIGREYLGQYIYDVPQLTGAIDGFPYYLIYSYFNFSYLYPLNHEYLILYGEGNQAGCNDGFNSDTGDCFNFCYGDQLYPEFGSRLIYIEKYIQGDKTHILIAPYEGYVIARENSAQDVLLYQSEQNAMVGSCQIARGTYGWYLLYNLKEEYKETVEAIISAGNGTNSYSVNPNIVYSIIYYQSQNNLGETANGRYGIMQLTLEDVAEHCSDLVAVNSTLNGENTSYSIIEDQEEILLEPETNLECGIKILNYYNSFIASQEGIESNVNNTLAAYYGGEDAITLLGLMIPDAQGYPTYIPDLIPKWTTDPLLQPQVEEIKGYYDCYSPYSTQSICAKPGTYGNDFDADVLMQWSEETGYNPCYVAAFVQGECLWDISSFNSYGYYGMFQWGESSFTDMVGKDSNNNRDRHLCAQDNPPYPNTCELNEHTDIISLGLREQLDLLKEYFDMRGITPEDDLGKMYQSVAFPWCMENTNDGEYRLDDRPNVGDVSVSNPRWRYTGGPDYATCKGIAYYAYDNAKADPELSMCSGLCSS